MQSIVSSVIGKMQKDSNAQFSLVLIVVGVLAGWLLTSTAKDDTWILTAPAEEVHSTAGLKETRLIYALKSGKHTIVYQRNLADGAQVKILEYDESVEYDPSSGNIWLAEPAHIALSPGKQYLAFVDEQGLKIYSLSDGTQRGLIIKSTITSPDIEVAPGWSTPSRGKVIEGGEWWGLCDMVVHGWSPDGKYISFFEAYTEGSGEGIIEVQTERWFSYWKGARSMSWSPASDLLLLASADCELGDPGLYVVKLDKLEQAEAQRVDEKLGLNDFLFSQAMFSPDGQKIVFLIEEMQTEGQKNVLAVANSDGTAFEILDEGDNFYKLTPLFSPDGSSIFYIEQRHRMVLRRCDLASGRKADVAILPYGWRSWRKGFYSVHDRIFWTEDGFLSLVGGNARESRLLILDVKHRKLVYASPIFSSLPAFAGFVK